MEKRKLRGTPEGYRPIHFFFACVIQRIPEVIINTATDVHRPCSWPEILTFDERLYVRLCLGK